VAYPPDGQPSDLGIRLFNVLDDFNREALAIEIDFSLPFERVIRALNQLIEWRGQYHWASLAQVQDDATAWMCSYNQDRPHMALGGMTPKQRLAMAA